MNFKLTFVSLVDFVAQMLLIISFNSREMMGHPSFIDLLNPQKSRAEEPVYIRSGPHSSGDSDS
jgi:hypothetical protein